MKTNNRYYALGAIQKAQSFLAEKNPLGFATGAPILRINTEEGGSLEDCGLSAFCVQWSGQRDETFIAHFDRYGKFVKLVKTHWVGDDLVHSIVSL